MVNIVKEVLRIIKDLENLKSKYTYEDNINEEEIVKDVLEEYRRKAEEDGKKILEEYKEKAERDYKGFLDLKEKIIKIYYERKLDIIKKVKNEVGKTI